MILLILCHWLHYPACWLELSAPMLSNQRSAIPSLPFYFYYKKSQFTHTIRHTALVIIILSFLPTLQQHGVAFTLTLPFYVFLMSEKQFIYVLSENSIMFLSMFYKVFDVTSRSGGKIISPKHNRNYESLLDLCSFACNTSRNAIKKTIDVKICFYYSKIVLLFTPLQYLSVFGPFFSFHNAASSLQEFVDQENNVR